MCCRSRNSDRNRKARRWGNRLVFAAIISAIAGEWPDALIIIAIVIGSTMLGFWQEFRASNVLGVKPGTITYGRTALIHCDHEPAIELLEVVRPEPT